MAYTPPVNISVNLQTAVASALGFGTQLFVDAHAWFRERSRAYSSLTAAGEDFPTDSNAYKALQAAFAQSPRPASVKIGRRQSTTILAPQNVVNGTIYTVRVEVNDGDFVSASYTAVVPTDDAQAVCTALKTAIDAATAVAAHVTTAVVGTGANATLSIAATLPTDEYAISGLGNLGYAFTTTETAADCRANISIENDDYFFVTSSDHTEAFVLGMAAECEGLTKMFFTSSQNEACLAALAVPATDTLGKLFDLGYDNTATMYHQTADTTFPECAWVARWSTATPGTVAWFDKDLNGVAAATALNGGTTPKPLTDTQKNNLEARKSNFVHVYMGLKTVEGGKVVGNEWIDVMQSKYYIENQTAVDLFTLKYNQPKISLTDIGINQIKCTCQSTWSRFVETESQPNILEAARPYSLSFPRAKDVPQVDKANRVYNASATLYLAGAIKHTNVTINLTYSTS